MHIGLELPPLAPGAAAVVPVVAAAAAEAGCTTVWLASSKDSLDACTLAGACAASAPDLDVGVVWLGPDDRHPAVLAREVTTVDILSGGRAAILLRWEPDPGADIAGVVQSLLEAAAICRLVLDGDGATFEGEVFHVAGAANRPAPLRPPPISLALPAGWADHILAGSAHLLGTPSSVVCSDGVDELRRWEAILGTRPPVVWDAPVPGQRPPAGGVILHVGAAAAAAAAGAGAAADDPAGLVAELVRPWTA